MCIRPTSIEFAGISIPVSFSVPAVIRTSIPFTHSEV